MIKLTIYGRLRKFVGQSTFEIDVASPRQAFSFLIHNFKGVAEHIKEQEYCVMAGKVRITQDLLDLQTESDIKIIPVVHGEILPFVVSLIGKGITAAISSGIITKALTIIATNLVIDGITSLIAGQPDRTNDVTEEQDPSFVFQGLTNISKQGVPINLVYGETLIGSNTISANVDTLQVRNS